MRIDTAIPPRYRRNPISRHWFVRNTKKRRLRFFKAAVFQMGVLIGLLHDGFFSFAVVRQIVLYLVVDKSDFINYRIIKRDFFRKCVFQCYTHNVPLLKIVN